MLVVRIEVWGRNEWLRCFFTGEQEGSRTVRKLKIRFL